MSRGLGKLQRDIKQFIEANDKRWNEECEKAGDGDPPEDCSPWVTWSDIRFRLFENGARNWPYWEAPDNPLWPPRERAGKRALHTLWKRGEIGRIHNAGCYHYMTAENYNESFSPEALAKLKKALERFAKST
jgi:hypothetical protein